MLTVGDTSYWAAEEMIKYAIHDESLRRIIAPAEMTGPGLHDVVEDTRSKLIVYLQGLAGLLARSPVVILVEPI